jgi:hypothetical protein
MADTNTRWIDSLERSNHGSNWLRGHVPHVRVFSQNVHVSLAPSTSSPSALFYIRNSIVIFSFSIFYRSTRPFRLTGSRPKSIQYCCPVVWSGRAQTSRGLGQSLRPRRLESALKLSDELCRLLAGHPAHSHGQPRTWARRAYGS